MADDVCDEGEALEFDLELAISLGEAEYNRFMTMTMEDLQERDAEVAQAEAACSRFLEMMKRTRRKGKRE
jgi:hypothetical protein